VGSFRAYADLGNTTLHVGLWRGEWLAGARLSAGEQGEGLAVHLSGLLQAAGVESSQCAGILLCTNSPMTDGVLATLSEVFAVHPRVVGKDVTVPLGVAYADPSQYGHDRLLAAWSALQMVGGPCIVLDAGTCMTCEAVKVTEVQPVGIAPGLGALRKGIQASAPALARAVERSTSQTASWPLLPARSTEDCLRVGLYGALAGAADRMVASARTLPGFAEAPLVVTGGNAPALLSLISTSARHEPLLLLDGLQRLDSLTA
jgi:pantothenate kinase type III